MKTFFRIIGVLLLLAIAGSYWYWQTYKKGIFKYIIRNAINTQTDSLYYVSYDSSSVDEINGNVYFQHVFLQSDSLQDIMLKDQENLPNSLFNVYINSVSATGIDVQAAIQLKELHANKIVLDGPRIQLIQTGANVMQLEDTIALYKKIVGDFKSINVDTIVIQHATFISRDKQNNIQTKLVNTSILLTKLNIDSTRDYSNVLSYFIENIVVHADTIHVNRKNNLGRVDFSNVDYNSSARTFKVDRIESFSNKFKNSHTYLNKLQLNELNTKAFIELHQIQTGQLSCEGGAITVYVKKQSSDNKLKNQSFDFPEDFFDEIEIGSLQLNKTDIIIRSNEFPDKEAITIKNVRLKVLNEINVVQRKTIRQIIAQANWEMDADGFTIQTNDRMYTITIQGIQLNKATASVNIASMRLKPNLSRTEFGKLVKKQTDYYSIDINNIRLKGVDFKSLINESSLVAQQALLKLDLRVFNDRMLAVNPTSKVGKYPHQQLLKVKMPIYIKQLLIEDSYISYTERALETQQSGEMLFTHVNGSVDNVTNIASRIQQNPVCTMNGSGMFLNTGKATTQWKLMLNSTKGDFSMIGKIGEMNAAAFNSLTKPLAMTSVKGSIHELSFRMNGDDNQANGDLRFLYNNMSVESFKMDSGKDTMKRNNFSSKINNLFLINDNPKKGTTRLPTFQSNREINKSFFNLIWKSVFDGIQKTIIGEKAAQLKNQLKKGK